MPQPVSFLVPCLALLPLVCGAADAPEKGELEGRWKVVSTILSAKLAAEPGAGNRAVLGTVHYIFAKGKLYSTSSNPAVGSIPQEFTLKTDVVPRQIDWAAKDAKEKSFGNYRLEKDKLTICVGSSAEKRPKEFKLDPDEPQALLELVRDEIAVDPDFEKLAGTWKVTRRQGSTVDGIPNNRQLEFVKSMEFEPLPYQNEGRVIWKDTKGKSLGSFSWKLDSSRSPKEVSLTGYFQNGKDERGFLLDGVYDFADGSLSLTMGPQGSRPESVKPKQPSKTARIGLTRMAKEE